MEGFAVGAEEVVYKGCFAGADLAGTWGKEMDLTVRFVGLVGEERAEKKNQEGMVENA